MDGGIIRCLSALFISVIPLISAYKGQHSHRGLIPCMDYRVFHVYKGRIKDNGRTFLLFSGLSGFSSV